MLNILTLPQYEKQLRQKSSQLDVALISSDKKQKFFNELGQTMLKADGVGLAAPQVNKLIRVIAININEQPQILINPKIIKKSWSKKILEEGCLSIPDVYGKVKRHKKIKVEYLDRQGKFHKNKFKDLTARVIQHEIDHLDGILFIDKIKE
jgi:peptide deformylase